MINKLNTKRLKPEFIIKEIEKSYNLEFLERLKKIPKIKIYVFGGFIRDILLGKKWKDLDIRILLNEDWDKREQSIENTLKKFVKIQEKLRFKQDKFTVYRFLPSKSSRKNSIDLTLAPTIRQAKSDFTINNIFVDIVNGEIVDRHNGLDDLKNGRLRTVVNPKKQFVQEPWMLFRTIKFACQFHLDVASEVYREMKNKAKISRTQLEAISSERKGLWIEVLLGNLFRGLNYDPYKYFEIFADTGLMNVLLDFLGDKLKVENLNFKKGKNIFSKNSKTSLEQNISTFLSFITNYLDVKDKRKCFTEIIHLLAMDEPKEFGEIDVDITKIRYNQI
ncbi:CCA tRNA nucleotidyltransferase [Candidatus Azambacteria bacterium]|nr:CCA tRNA nucleotidyltransferase [Candidatus Azambacteria bacterium]